MAMGCSIYADSHHKHHRIIFEGTTKIRMKLFKLFFCIFLSRLAVHLLRINFLHNQGKKGSRWNCYILKMRGDLRQGLMCEEVMVLEMSYQRLIAFIPNDISSPLPPHPPLFFFFHNTLLQKMKRFIHSETHLVDQTEELRVCSKYQRTHFWSQGRFWIGYYNVISWKSRNEICMQGIW